MKAKRSAVLRQMRAQAICDAAAAVSWLRDNVERYRALDPPSKEAQDTAGLFEDGLIIWGNEARFEAAGSIPCGLSLDLDCEAAEDYSIDELSVVSASVIYHGGIYVHVPSIEQELHELLIAVQRIVEDEDDRQLRQADEEEVF